MNTFMNEMKKESNYTVTENGALTHRTTLDKVWDMFAFGGAYRKRTNEDCILLFKEAYEQNPVYALKCLFYLSDCRGGQGERRFFRVCFNWLAKKYPDKAAELVPMIPEYRRWDDIIYSCIDTPVQEVAFKFINHQLCLDMESKTPSLCAKWMPSENASSCTTKRAASYLRTYLKLTHKEYRAMLSHLRQKINIVERLMSENRWDEIEFDKLPSQAGLKYKNTFAHKEITAARYKAFMESKSTKVNASVLNPVEIANKAFDCRADLESAERLAIQKYWDSLPNYYNGEPENGIAVVDVSGSMSGTPMAAAVSLGAYIAEKSHGPFANHFITFSSNPNFVEFVGVDIVDKFKRCLRADWGMNTNIEAVFDLLLSIAKRKNVKPEDMPKRLYIFTDMEFDAATTSWSYGRRSDSINKDTLFESIAKRWREAGYEMPHLIFWNLDARQNNIPMLSDGVYSYVSGFNPSMIKYILSGKNGIDLMYETLDSDRYKDIK